MQNQFLEVLSAQVRERLSAHLDRVSFHIGDVLHESGRALRHVCFPADGVVSLVCETRDGESAEVALVGNEGFLGVEIFLGGQSTTCRAIVQSECEAFLLPTHCFMAEFNRHGELMVQTLRYAQSLIAQMAQIAACNRHHRIEQQLCHRLLLLWDRMSADRLGLTQERLAGTLGVRRESITEAARRLQSLGAIDYRRGQIRVLDREMLEKLCCECYEAVRKEALRLQPFLQSSHRPIEPERVIPRADPAARRTKKKPARKAGSSLAAK